MSPTHSYTHLTGLPVSLLRKANAWLPSRPAGHNVCLPRAKGIELMELGGMTPTSVTTAVMLVGGVKSYSGFRISRFGWPWRFSVSRGRVRGYDDSKSLDGAVANVSTM
jgi:hypothetical protein